MRAVLAIACLILTGCQQTLPPEFEDCRDQTVAAVVAAGIPESSIRRIESAPVRQFFRSRYGGADDRIVGYSNWVRFYDCEGAVVFEFNRFCRVRYAYARGNCGQPRQPELRTAPTP